MQKTFQKSPSSVDAPHSVAFPLPLAPLDPQHRHHTNRTCTYNSSSPTTAHNNTSFASGNVELVNVEETVDKVVGGGDRYLLEVVVEDSKQVKKRLSVYLYKPFNTRRLCYPKNFQWTNDVMVNLILTTKNQGAWVQQYIESLSNIYTKTKDDRFNLIITDFDSFDIDLEGALRRSPLPNWQIIKKKWKFHKTSAIEDAINSIQDLNSIALQTDLHLEFPLNFIDDTRKHCVQGGMGYTPLLMRLTFLSQ